MQLINNKRIAKNTLFLYFRMLLIMLVTLYTSRVVLKSLGVEDFGIYNVVGGFVSMLSFLNTSIANGFQRFFNFELGKERIGTVKRMFSVSLSIQIGLSLLILLLAETVGLWFLNASMNIPSDRIVAANWVYQCSVLMLIITLFRAPYDAIIIANEKMDFYAYIGICGKFGLPELGLLGAGISTLFSRIVMVIAFAFIVFRSRRFLRYKLGFFRLGWSKEMFRRLNALGWPVGLQMGMEAASFSLSTIMVGWLGTIALASHQIMLTISQFTFMMFYGMGAAVAVRVSNFKGQNDMVNVRRSAYAGFHLIMAMAVVLLSIVFLYLVQI